MNARVHLDTRASADYLGLSPRTLEHWRLRGIGPPFRRLGRAVRYDVRSLDRWLESKGEFTSTAQAAGA